MRGSIVRAAREATYSLQVKSQHPVTFQKRPSLYLTALLPGMEPAAPRVLIRVICRAVQCSDKEAR
jgi:hypothetical protein